MPNTAPIAIQLYTVRDLLAEDFAGTVRQVADIGYAGVEPFGMPDSVTQAAALFDELGLAVPSAHLPLPIGEDKDRVLDIAAAYDLDYIVSGRGPEDFETPAGIKHTCDLFNEAQRIAAEHGYAFGIHNHWWEFEQVDGEYVYHIMLEHLDPAITFEVDVYWVQAAGLDPAGDPRVEAIAQATRELVEKRQAWLNPPGASEKELKKRTLTNLYNEYPTWLELAHRKLDEAVLDAYGWPHDIDDEEILRRLLELNLERAKIE